MAPRVVLIAGAVVLVLVIVLGGTRTKHLVLGSNDVRPGAFVAIVGPDEVLCQTGQTVPATTGLLAMTIGTYGRPGPELRTAVEDRRGRPLVPAGRLAAGWRQGQILVPLGADIPRTDEARICIANRGTHRIAVAGLERERRVVARVAGRAAWGRVGMVYLTGERRSPLSRTSAIVDRIAAGHAVWGAGAPWLVIALILLALSFVARATWSAR